MFCLPAERGKREGQGCFGLAICHAQRPGHSFLQKAPALRLSGLQVTSMRCAMLAPSLTLLHMTACKANKTNGPAWMQPFTPGHLYCFTRQHLRLAWLHPCRASHT